jgi:hypothetical protein
MDNGFERVYPSDGKPMQSWNQVLEMVMSMPTEVSLDYKIPLSLKLPKHLSMRKGDPAVNIFERRKGEGYNAADAWWQ